MMPIIRSVFVFLVISLITVPGYAQHTVRHARKHKAQKEAEVVKVPDWGPAHHYDATAHVYFPDYYTYYDPNRGGYVYWDKDKYVFTPALPPFMEKADLNKARVKILKGLSLDLHPEQDYPHYMKLYPPDGNGKTL